jgi:hypothetical protein
VEKSSRREGSIAGLFGLPESPERRKKQPLLARIGKVYNS